MQLYRKIDDKGFFIEDVILEDVPFVYDEDYNKIPDPNHISTPVQNGLYRPRWTGTEWVEGLTKDEIDTIKNEVKVEPSELDILKARQDATEDALLFLMDIGRRGL